MKGVLSVERNTRSLYIDFIKREVLSCVCCLRIEGVHLMVLLIDKVGRMGSNWLGEGI